MINKSVINPFMKKSLITFLLIGGISLLSSCLPDRDPVTPPDAAFVTIYHGSPDAPNLDIYAETNRINNSPLTYGNSFPYSQFFIGQSLLRFTPHNAANTVLETTHTFEKDKVYSIFIINRLAEIEAIKVEDKWSDPTSENAQIRLAHLSPDSGNIRVKIGEEEVFFGAANNFEEVTSFKDLEKGKYSVSILNEDGSKELLKINEIEIRGNRVYSLIVRGFADSENGNNPLSAQLLTNYIKF